jgi:hypothetical protein
MRDSALKTTSMVRHGSSLIELLAAIAIASIGLTALARIYENAIRAYRLATKEAAEVRIEGRLTGLLADIVDSHSSAPFEGTLKLHPPGKLLYENNSEVQLDIQPNSHAISGIDFRLSAAGLVSSDNGRLSVCGDNTWSDIKTFIALSNEGWSEVLVNSETSNGRCKAVKLEKPSSSIFKTSDFTRLDLVQKIVPAEIFSFYLTSAGEVKRAMHIGNRLIENQPMFGTLNELSFALADREVSIWYKRNGRCSDGCRLKNPLRLVSRSTLPFLFLR